MLCHMMFTHQEVLVEVEKTKQANLNTTVTKVLPNI